MLAALQRWSSNTGKNVWELAWADSTLVILDNRGGYLSRFDCNTCLFNNPGSGKAGGFYIKQWCKANEVKIVKTR